MNKLTDRQKQAAYQFMEQDIEKFGGLLRVYIRMIEAKIPFAPNVDHAEGMAAATKILWDGVNKGEEVLRQVKAGEFKKLEEAMAEEERPPALRKKEDN